MSVIAVLASLKGSVLFCVLHAVMVARVVLIFQIFVLLCLSFPPSVYATEESSDLPCDYLHSVNISDGQRDNDGRILHRGVSYDSINYASVDYSYDDARNRIAVAVHTRGCVCQVKNCVWLCCKREEISYRGEYPTCSSFNDTDGLVVEMINGTNVEENVDLITRENIFLMVFEGSCDLFDAKPNEWKMNAVSETFKLKSCTDYKN